MSTKKNEDNKITICCGAFNLNKQNELVFEASEIKEQETNVEELRLPLEGEWKVKEKAKRKATTTKSKTTGKRTTATKKTETKTGKTKAAQTTEKRKPGRPRKTNKALEGEER